MSRILLISLFVVLVGCESSLPPLRTIPAEKKEKASVLARFKGICYPEDLSPHKHYVLVRENLDSLYHNNQVVVDDEEGNRLIVNQMGPVQGTPSQGGKNMVRIGIIRFRENYMTGLVWVEDVPLTTGVSHDG